MRHDIVACAQFFEVHHRHRQPGAQQAGSHRRGALVEHVHERHALAAGGGREHFQVAQRELVHPDEPVGVDAGDAADVLHSGVEGLFEVDHQGAGGTDAQRVAVDRETLERLDGELFLEPFDGGVIDEGPLFDGRQVEPFAEPLADAPFVPALDDDFLGVERGEQGGDVVQ